MNNATVSDSILEKIRKVKALAESPNENEAAVATAMLTRMLQEYDLSISEIPDKAPENNPLTKDVWVDGGTEQLKPWKIDIAHTIANVTFTKLLLGRKYFYDEPKKKNGSTPHRAVYEFIGHKNDAEVAAYIFKVLTDKLGEMAKSRTSEYVAKFKEEQRADPWTFPPPHHPMTWRSCWLSGAVTTIQETLRKEYAQFKAQPKGGELVVLKDQLVRQYVKENFPHLTSHHSGGNGNFNSGAYAQGRADGMNIRAERGIGGSGASKGLPRGK